MTSQHRPRTATEATVLGGLVTVVCLLPLFLTAALSAVLMRDLNFGSAGLGVAVAMARGTGAVLSPFLGRLADRLGSTWSIRAAALGSAIASLGIAVTVDNWLALVCWLMVNGGAQALGTPAANRLVARSTALKHLGFAFGLKQSAPPGASMLAGLSVPLIALTLGWRWAYACCALMGFAVAAMAGPGPPGKRLGAVPREGLFDRRGIVVILAVAFGLGTSASSALTTFFVDASVRAGSEASFAGTMLASASVAAIAARISVGALCDRLATGHLRICAVMLSGGAVGLGFIASNDPSVMALGALIAAAGAWGFNGVFWYALMRAYPQSPGRITGALAPGALLGATIGPALLGLLAESTSFPTTWAVAAFLALLGAAAMLVANHYLSASDRIQPPLTDLD